MSYESDLERLQSSAERRDLNLFQKVATQVEEGARQESIEDYSRLVRDICRLVHSIDFREYERQTVLGEHFAASGLRFSDQIPIDIQFELLLYLQVPIGKPGTDWSGTRARNAEFWLKAWRRLEMETSQDFDFRDVPLLNVPPPIEGMPSGVAPDAIADPKLRLEYEKALAENVRKAAQYLKQDSLRKIRMVYGPKLEEYLVQAYSKPPLKYEELQNYLVTFVTDLEKRQRILSAVARS